MVQRTATTLPGAPVAAGGRERAAEKLERERAVSRRDADGPAAAARRDVATCVDKTRPGRGERLGRTFGCVAFADAAEIDADARLELDAVAVDAHPAAGRHRCAGVCAVGRH